MIPPRTPAGALRDATRLLGAAGVPDGATDARVLLCAAAGLDRASLLRDPDTPLGTGAVARFETLLRRRLAREPVSRILGRRAFWSLDLAVTAAVLDPRPDTETLVSAVLDHVGARRGAPWRILDLGTGSGAILCALLSELPEARGHALDSSFPACAVARANLRACGLAGRSLVVQGSWGDAVAPGLSDIVVANPPYVATATIAALDPEVRDHDPREALDGGRDGLDAYRAIAAQAPGLLAPGGLLGLEVGIGQASAVSGLLAAAGMSCRGARRDLAGIERVVTAVR